MSISVKGLQSALRDILKVRDGVLQEEPDDRWNFYVPFKVIEAVQTVFSHAGEKAIKKAFPGFEGWIHIKPITPKLVPAKLGDLVLIYTDWEYSERDFPVGIVTSVLKQGKKVCYGCRYIIPTDRYLDRNEMAEIKFSEEDYGGNPPGFYKVLTRDEAIEQVSRQARESIIKKIAKLNEAAGEVEETIGKLLNQFKHKVTIHSLRTEAVRPKEYDR